MATTEKPEQFTFQAEIKELLHLLSHSLYQNREITIRELVSNASDALDKLRYERLTGGESAAEAGDLEITIAAEKDERLLTIGDNGIGMSKQDLIDNLGTIARSGSREFLSRMAADRKGDVNLIGQFGVGFYSAFMLAETVDVLTRKHDEEQGWRWTSAGTGQFEIEAAAEVPAGTQVRLHLKEDATEFTSPERLKFILQKYSAFVPHRIKLNGELLNSQPPIWVEPKSQLTDEQYAEFYQYLAHGTEERPRWHLHVASETPFEFKAVLFCPSSNFEKLGFGKYDQGLHLCAKRILVQNDNTDLLPDYLRFVIGLVDSADLPLNVSRESLQDNTVFRKIRKVLVKKVLGHLEDAKSGNAESYREFYAEFGPILREGVSSDFEHREALSNLLLFPSPKAGGSGGVTSLSEYVSRMNESQEQIYYLCGASRESVARNPHLEIFHKRDLEVLYLTDPVDELVLGNLGSFDGKTIVSVDSAEVKIPDAAEAEGEDRAEEEPEAPQGFDRLLEIFQSAVGGRIAEVRASERLTDSPCCLVNKDGKMSTQLQKLLQMQHEDFPMSEQILEINPRAALIRRLSAISVNPDNEAFLKECGETLLDQALLVEGIAPDGEGLASRMLSMMQQLADGKSSIVT